MNAIFVNTKKGIVKATVIFNPFVKKHQLFIDNVLYNEFLSNEENIAIKYMKGSFSDEQIIKPNITLLISSDNPLSSQCLRITGDSFNIIDFEELYHTQLIKHRKTGLIFRVISKDMIKEQFKADWFYQEGIKCNNKPAVPQRNLALKAGEFLYLGHIFRGVRKFETKEDIFYITTRLTTIWRSKKDTGNTNWNIKEFYEQAQKAGAENYDVFQMDDLFNVVPCENYLGEYKETK